MPPIAFAHRGGRAHAPENTIAAFHTAIALGAHGIETDAWVTRDGSVVLHHGAMVGRRGRRTAISSLALQDLPDEIPTLDKLFDLVTDEQHIFIDVKGGAITALANVVNRRRPTHDARVWLAHAGFNDSDWKTVASWRALVPNVTLVDSTSVQRMGINPDYYLDTIAAAGLQCLNLPVGEWTPSLVEACRVRGLKTMAFRAHTPRKVRKAVALGLDAMHGDNVNTMLRALAR